jgi:hypothetical protein
VGRWMASDVDGLPHPASCRVLEQMFGESAERLFGPPDPVSRRQIATVEVPHPPLVGAEPVEDLIVQREVVMAAAESARFGQFAEQSNVGPHTLEQFRADLARIVTTYPNRPVYPIFVELRGLRNRAFELLEGRQYPEQSRELYLVAGMLCGVLANASFDLGWLPAAETQARTAFLCAELAGSNALRAWVRGTQSLVAYWDKRPRAAVELAMDGWRYVPETDAERDAAHAVELYEGDPPEQRRLGELCLVRLDLAAARLGRDDLDGSAEQLQIVLAIAAQRCTESISRRLHQVGRALQRPRYQTSALALDLYDQIHSFTHRSASPTLPGADR